jgi:hypothetical protein
MPDTDFTFEQQCLSPAERQAEAAQYSGGHDEYTKFDFQDTEQAAR